MHANLLLGEDQQDAALAASTEAVQLLRPLAREHAFDYLWGLLAHADLMASLDRNEEAVAAADEDRPRPRPSSRTTLPFGSNCWGAERVAWRVRFLRYAEKSRARLCANRRHEQGGIWIRESTVALLALPARAVDGLDGATRRGPCRIERLLNVPASGAEHPMASIAARVELLRIENQQRVTDLSQVLSQAKSAACGEGGAPQLCAKVKLIDVENLLRSGRTADARVLLAALGEDAAFGQAPSLAAQLLLLRARSDRLQGQFEAAGQLLAEARSKAATNKRRSSPKLMSSRAISHRPREIVSAPLKP